MVFSFKGTAIYSMEIGYLKNGRNGSRGSNTKYKVWAESSSSTEFKVTLKKKKKNWM